MDTHFFESNYLISLFMIHAQKCWWGETKFTLVGRISVYDVISDAEFSFRMNN